MISRRNFLKTSALTLGASQLAPLGALAAQASGYKALVCVFLFGGCDAHDVLVNHDQPSYDLWAAQRRSILDRFPGGASEGARARANLLELDPLNAADFGSQRFALPPEMSGIKSLFDAGRAAIVPNVGPLVEPADRQSVEDRTILLPPRLASHNDQQSTWQAFAGEGAGQGWGGLVMDAINESSPYTAVSVAGQTVFLSGQQTRQLQLPASGSIPQAYGTVGDVFGSQDVAERLRTYYRTSADHLQHPMMRDLVAAQRKAIADTGELASLIDGAQLGESVRLPDNHLSEQLARVADMIAVRGSLSVNRQVFFVGMGSYDTHSDHVERMPGLLTQLSDAVTSFTNAMDGAGLGNDVTLFTASEFGRTLTANSSGTDHGWGGHQIVAGGAVRGRRIHGDVPPPMVDHPQAFRSRGAMIPQLSVEQYASELARWFGLGESELDAVFPNRGRFDPLALQLF